MQMRRKNLRFQYNFLCECVACVDDYPPFANLPYAPLQGVVTDTDIKKLESFTLDCEDLYFKYCMFLATADKHYPSVQVNSTQECLKMCFFLLMRNVPLALRAKV